MLFYRLVLIFSLLFIGCDTILSQTNGINRDTYQVHIFKTDKPIKIDGIFDEEPWNTAEIKGKFHRVTPVDTGYAIAQTEVMVTYDESNLYVAAICYDPTPGKRPIQSLRRDFSFSRNDNFMFFIDTYNDLTNGFAFGISEAGVQRDGIESNGDEVAYTGIQSGNQQYVVMTIAGQQRLAFPSAVYATLTDQLYGELISDVST